MALPFADRTQAGYELALALAPLHPRDQLVLGVPRGGVAVAEPVARMLRAPLDVIVVRKIGAPGEPELGIGAVGASGHPWIDDRAIELVGASAAYVAEETERQRTEARRRHGLYRGDVEPLQVTGRDVIVVDDGIATGSTVTAAAQILRDQSPNRLILGVPVAPAESVTKLQGTYDLVVAVHTPEPYVAVGQWYRDFHQVSDEEVSALLASGS